MYLYIWEDGQIRQSSDSPTAIDMLCVSDGTLQVFQLKMDGGFQELLPTGGAREVPKANLDCGGTSWATAEYFHIP